MSKLTDRILAEYAARDAARSGIERPAIEHRANADFGTINGAQTAAELQDLMTLWSGRVQAMAGWYGANMAAWNSRDSAAFVDWASDYTAMLGRYAHAQAEAQKFLDAQKYAPVPFYMTPAQYQYDGLMKAMRQGYPPDGAPTQKGDWQDLYARANAAAKALGLQPLGDSPPQPTAPDYDRQVLAQTQPVDVLGQLGGLIAPKPGSGAPKGKVSWGFIGLSAGVVGGLGLAAGGPYAGLAGLAVGAFVADAVQSKIQGLLPSWL